MMQKSLLLTLAFTAASLGAMATPVQPAGTVIFDGWTYPTGFLVNKAWGSLACKIPLLPFKKPFEGSLKDVPQYLRAMAYMQFLQDKTKYNAPTDQFRDAATKYPVVEKYLPEIHQLMAKSHSVSPAQAALAQSLNKNYALVLSTNHDEKSMQEALTYLCRDNKLSQDNKKTVTAIDTVIVVPSCQYDASTFTNGNSPKIEVVKAPFYSPTYIEKMYAIAGQKDAKQPVYFVSDNQKHLDTVTAQNKSIIPVYCASKNPDVVKAALEKAGIKLD